MFANKNSKGTATLWLIIAGLILIAGSGYWYWYANTIAVNCQPQYCPDGTIHFSSPPECKPGTCTTKKTSTENIQELENWKTYSNEKYGFEVKYPPDWVVDYSDVPREIIFVDAAKGGVMVGITAYNLKENNPEFVKKYLNGDFPDGCVDGKGLFQLPLVTLKMTCGPRPESKLLITEIYIIKNDDILFELAFQKKIGDVKSDVLFNKIAESFHF